MDQPRHLLLVEDDEAVRKVLAILLVRAGYLISQAASAAAALSLHGSETFDLAIIDLGLGDLRGDKLAAKLAPLPVIVLSGSEPSRTLPSNIRAVLQKPSPMPMLLNAISELLEGQG